MKSLTPLVLVFFVLSGTIRAQKTVEIDNPPEAPGFIGYVEDEFIMVLKEHPGTILPVLSVSATEVVLSMFSSFSCSSQLQYLATRYQNSAQ